MNKLVATVVLSLLHAGCAHAPVRGSGGYDVSSAGKAERSAIRYFLAKDVIVVEAEVTRRRETTVVAQKDGAGRFTFEPRTRIHLSGARATLTPRTVADASAFFQVELSHGGASADALTVEVGEDGLLRAVNAESRSQAGALLEQGIRVAAAAASVAGGLSGAPAELVSQVQSLFSAEEARAPGLSASLAGAPLLTLYLLQEDPAARALWTRRLDVEAQRGRRAADRERLEDEIAGGKRAEVQDLEARLGLVDAADKRASAAQQALTAALEERRDELMRTRHLGSEEIRDRVTMVLDLADAPPKEALESGLAPTEVRRRLAGYPRMARLYEETRVAFTLEMPPIAADDPNAVPPADGRDPGRGEGRFYFRQSYPGVMRVFAGAMRPPRAALEATRPGSGSAAESADEEQIRVVEERIVDLVPPSAPRLFVTFSSRDFTERKLSLQLDDKGRVRRIERSGGAAWAGAAGTLGPALDAALTDRVSTLRKLAEAEAAREELHAKDGGAQRGEIDELRRKLAALSATIAALTAKMEATR